MSTHICSASHECNILDCHHRKPHRNEKCGPAMTCYDSKILSLCVPVKNGTYVDPFIPSPSCKHCGGSGSENIKNTFSVDNPTEQLNGGE